VSKQILPYQVQDLSALARSLCRQIETHHAANERPPSHLALLNMLARAAGHSNYQSYRVGAELRPAPELAGPTPPAALSADAEKVLRLLDSAGRLTRWPVKRGVQRLAVWYLWSLFEGRKVYTEREVTALLATRNDFDDPVILRRELINEGLFVRTPDGREYRKEARRAPAEAAALLRAIRARLKKPRPPRNKE
jgi:hypothetical protein